MKGLIIILVYRLFTFKAIGFTFAIIGINIAVNFIYMHTNVPLINILNEVSYYAKSYFFESLFFFKITMMLIIMVFTYLLFNEPKLDIALVTKQDRAIVYLAKLGLIIFITTLLMVFCMINMIFIYGFTPYHQAFYVDKLVYLQLLVLISYYVPLNALLMTFRPSLYTGICVLLVFLASEVMMGFGSTIEDLSLFSQIIAHIFPSIQPFNQGLYLTVHWSVVGVLTLVYTSVGGMVQYYIDY